MGGTEIDHTPCFERARRDRVTLLKSPTAGMDFRVQRVVLTDHALGPTSLVDDGGSWDACLQDGGKTLKLFRVPDHSPASTDGTGEST